jgi:hypothetical protein
MKVIEANKVLVSANVYGYYVKKWYVYIESKAGRGTIRLIQV